MSPEEALLRVLTLTGLSFPRGVLGPETWALARALSDESSASDPAVLAAAAAAEHWPLLRGPMETALLQAAAQAAPEDAEAFEIVLGWAADPDPDTPLARALAVRAATELAAAGLRSSERLLAAEPVVAEGGPPAAIAAARAAGAIAVDLLDLDPEDFALEIADYVDAGRRPEDVDALARASGDPEIRAWARAAVAATEEPRAPHAEEGVRVLASGPPPPDPAEDLIWVPTILSLVEEGIERALVADEPEWRRESDAHVDSGPLLGTARWWRRCARQSSPRGCTLAVDFSTTALDHARVRAESLGEGVAERIDWVEGDLATWTPRPDHYDLVACLYVHVGGSVAEMVRRLGEGVARGGTLLLVGHGPVDPTTGAPTSAADQVQVSVDTAIAALDARRWEIVVAEDRQRETAGTGVDAVVRARRRT